MKTNNITCRRVRAYNIPNLILPPEEANITLGKWGIMHKDYLLKHKKVLFTILLTQGNLYQHCAEVEKQAVEKSAGIYNIQFVKQDASSLDMFEDNEFDLVLCFDGAISFSGNKAGKVIEEICRVGKKVMLSVSNKSCMTATWLNYSLTKLNRIHPSVNDMMKTGYFNKDNYDDAEELTSISELKAYDTDELKDALVENGMNVLECHSIGSLTHLYLMHLYRQNTAEDVHKKINEISTDKDFLEICDYYDKHVMPNGMGSFRRAGIFAIAEKI